MRIIELTEEEHRYLSGILEEILNEDGYIGGKWRELASAHEMKIFRLYGVKHKLGWAERWVKSQR